MYGPIQACLPLSGLQTTNAIAVQLSINVSTVRKHLESIDSKFGVHSRTEEIAQALTKLGILNSTPLV